MVTDYMISVKLEDYTWYGQPSWPYWQRIFSWQYHVNHMWLPGWLCLVLTEFMVTWQNALPNKFFEMELENIVGYVLLSNIYTAAGNMHLCENVEWKRKEKGAKENQVAPGLQ